MARNARRKTLSQKRQTGRKSPKAAGRAIQGMGGVTQGTDRTGRGRAY